MILSNRKKHQFGMKNLSMSKILQYDPNIGLIYVLFFKKFQLTI